MFLISVRRFQLWERTSLALVHALHNFEHTPAHIADMLARMAIKYETPTLAAEVIRYVCGPRTPFMHATTPLATLAGPYFFCATHFV